MLILIVIVNGLACDCGVCRIFNYVISPILQAFCSLTRFDVYGTLCPQQMLVHKGGQIKNWSGEYRDIIPTKLQCQAIQRAPQSPNLQR